MATLLVSDGRKPGFIQGNWVLARPVSCLVCGHPVGYPRFRTNGHTSQMRAHWLMGEVQVVRHGTSHWHLHMTARRRKPMYTYAIHKVRSGWLMHLHHPRDLMKFGVWRTLQLTAPKETAASKSARFSRATSKPRFQTLRARLQSAPLTLQNRYDQVSGSEDLWKRLIKQQHAYRS